MPLQTIEGVQVDFPHEPYQCQIDYMQHNIRALHAGTNALLESPTGTGKTLCLLTSTLAWQAKQRKLQKQSSAHREAMEKANGVNQQETKKEKKAPTLTIIYASRTHSQLAQVVGELRRTSYTPKVTVLGSREQLCIHDGLKNLRGNRLNHACSQKCAANSCKHKNNLQSYAGPKGKKKDIPIHDIEDLVKMGKQNSICPYFYTRDFAADADLVFVPYNYLLDNNIRETLRINWQGSIIIFDEAHNIERVAGDAASFTMTSADIGACIGELQKVLASLQNAGLGGDDTDSDILDVGGGKGDGKAETPTLRGVVRILKALFEFEKMIDRVPLRSGLGKTVSCTLPGDWMYTTLEQCGFSYRDALYNINELRRCSNYIIDKVMDAMGGNNALGTQTEPKLNLLLKAFTRVFSGKQEDMLRRASDYKVFVCEEDEKKKFSNYNRNSYGGYGDQDQHKKKRVVNYWAFSSGIAMADLKNLGVRSIILTSGTLSPLGSFRDDLKLPFRVELENPHVINNNQIWVGAFGAGPTGKSLCSTYQRRETAEYKDELGLSIVQILQTMSGRGGQGAVAGRELRGGILVFFSGYAVMDAVVEHWKNSSHNIYERLKAVGGDIVVEPKGQASRPSNATSNANNNSDRQSRPAKGNKMAAGETVDDDEEEGTDSVLNGVIGDFERALKRRGRCILLAVCRGKISEGIDFRDSKARIVIITGIPYAPHMDPYVVLKRQYLDENVSASNASIGMQPHTDAGVRQGEGVLALPASINKNGPTQKTDANMYRSSSDVYGSTSSSSSNQRNATVGANGVINVRIPALSALRAPERKTAGNLPSYGGTGDTSIHTNAGLCPTPIEEISNPQMPPPVLSTITDTTQHTTAQTTTDATSDNATGALENGSSMQPQSTAVRTVHADISGPKLTGQGWYNQNASRAVNQAIGRVIRHKNDWGAIFLLDSRFMGDKQKRELSGWVRNRVKNHKELNPAMSDFRGFISHAMADPTLHNNDAADLNNAGTSAPVGMATVTSAGQSGSHVTRPVDSTVFNRRVIVRGSQLESGGDDELDDADNVGNAFIDPRLLETQPMSQMSQADQANPQKRRGYVTVSYEEQAKNVNIGAMISRLKTGGSTGETDKNTAKSIGDVFKAGARSNSTGMHDVQPMGASHDSLKRSRSEEVRGLIRDDRKAIERVFQSDTADVVGLSSSSSSSSKTIGLSANDFEVFSQFTQLSQPPQSRLGQRAEPAHKSLQPLSQDALVLLGKSDDAFADIVPSTQSSNAAHSQPLATHGNAAANGIGLSTNSAPRMTFGLSSNMKKVSSEGIIHKAATGTSGKIKEGSERAKDAELASLLGRLKGMLSSSEYAQFKSEAKQAKEKGLRSPMQIQAFATSLAPIFKNIGEVAAAEVFQGLTVLLRKDTLSHLFRTIAVKSHRQARLKMYNVVVDDKGAQAHSSTAGDSNKASSSVVKAQSSGSSAASTGVSQAESGMTALLSSYGLKSNIGFRSQSTISASTPTPAPSVRKEREGKLDVSGSSAPQASAGPVGPAGTARKRMLPDETRNKGPKNANVESGAASGTAQSLADKRPSAGPAEESNPRKPVKLSCIICKEVPNVPCANRCGHVCCQSCWGEWLKVKEVCPMCREKANKENISRLIIR